MRYIRLTLAYDGSGFHGWQVQPGVPTIQGVLTEVARKITQENVVLHGASRTDAGVHALGQVSHFRTQCALSAGEFQRALNALLPPPIRVVEAEEVGPDFHPRWQALAKTYAYRVYRGQVLPPTEYRRVLHYPFPLDEAAMIEAARLFEGEHDFSSFAASSGSEEDDRDRNPVREILHAGMLRRRPPLWPGTLPEAIPSWVMPPPAEDAYELAFFVRGKSFLRYMVRKMVGTLLEIGRGRMKPEDIPRLFAMPDRSRSGPTAPPGGLYLISLEYPDPTDSLGTSGREIR